MPGRLKGIDSRVNSRANQQGAERSELSIGSLPLGSLSLMALRLRALVVLSFALSFTLSFTLSEPVRRLHCLSQLGDALAVPVGLTLSFVFDII